MTIYTGVGVNPGRIIGPALQMPPAISEPPVGQSLASDSSAESALTALKAAANSVQSSLRARAVAATGDARAVLEATALMAADPMLIKAAAKKKTCSTE